MIYQKPVPTPAQREVMIEVVRESLLSETGAGSDLEYAASTWGVPDAMEVHGSLDLGHLVEEVVMKWEEIR